MRRKPVNYLVSSAFGIACCEALLTRVGELGPATLIAMVFTLIYTVAVTGLGLVQETGIENWADAARSWMRSKLGARKQWIYALATLLIAGGFETASVMSDWIEVTVSIDLSGAARFASVVGAAVTAARLQPARGMLVIVSVLLMDLGSTLMSPQGTPPTPAMALVTHGAALWLYFYLTERADRAIKGWQRNVSNARELG